MRNDSTDTVKLVARDAAASVGVRYVIVRSATGQGKSCGLRLKDCLVNVLEGVGDVLCEMRTSPRTVRRFVAGRVALSMLPGVLLKEVAMHDTVLIW